MRLLSQPPVVVVAACVVLVCVALSWTTFDAVSFQGSVQPLPNAVPRQRLPSLNRTSSKLFPKLLHYMWKNPTVAPPSETVRWQRGCKAVNPDHEFRMYYDADLLSFVEREYPEYLTLFRALKGVYMADMARVLVIYHYGGVYMDLDFYCYRPFACIADAFLPPEVLAHETDVLVVSLEPAVHANIFRDKDRVVIQDFYMATPRHPFFKWFLDDRLRKFQRDPSHPPKGPFSYSIEVDIDTYRKAATESKKLATAAAKKTKSSVDDGSGGGGGGGSGGGNSGGGKDTPAATASSTGSSGGNSAGAEVRYGLIYELPEDVLHALVDNTNPRLETVCSGKDKKAVSGDIVKDKDKAKDKKAGTAPGGIPPWAVASCAKVKKRQYFTPTDRTVAVHMWTHTFLGWSFFRGLYNSAVYERVERTLRPQMSCPAQFDRAHVAVQ